MALAFLALRANKSLNLEPSSRREKPTTPKRKTKNKQKAKAGANVEGLSRTFSSDTFDMTTLLLHAAIIHSVFDERKTCNGE